MKWRRRAGYPHRLAAAKGNALAEKGNPRNTGIPYIFRTHQKGLLAFHVSPCFASLSWCARLGSNQQPLPSEGSTLSIELRARMSGGTAFHIKNNGGRAAA